MNDFIQGSYNKYEHDFTERTDSQLTERLDYLFDNVKEGVFVGRRLLQVQKEMSQLTFEIGARFKQPEGYTEQEKSIILSLGGKL